MAGPPRLTYDGENRPKVKASLSGGRFHFTLRERAKGLLLERLSYNQGEEVPWQLFKVLVLAGDANFPNTQDELDLAEDLVEPNPHRKPTDNEARALASHLEGNDLNERQVSALATELTTFGLDSHVDFEKLGGESGTTEESQEITTESESGSVELAADSPSETAAETPEGAPTQTSDGAASDSIDDPLVQTMMLLAERLVRSGSASLESLSNDDLIDLYTLLSEVKSDGESRRKQARDVLIERIKEDTKLEGSIGTIERKTRRRKSLKDESEIFDILADAGVGHTEVMSVELDKKKLEKVAKKHDIPEEEFFEVNESAYVRRVSTDDEKRRAAFERIQGSG